MIDISLLTLIMFIVAAVIIAIIFIITAIVIAKYRKLSYLDRQDKEDEPH